MTCHEARDLFSAVVDDALDERERAAVDAHLIGCADCRRELDRFRRTVALVQTVPPERAPAGFVDRVVTRAGQASRARPASWPARLVRGLFVPWTTKLPLEVAAILVVAGLAVWIFQRTPQQQRSARLEPQPPRVEAPARVEEPAHVEAPARGEAPAPVERFAAPENAPAATTPSLPASPDNTPNEKKETQQAPADVRTAESPPAAASAARAPSAPGSPDVSGRLTTDDPSGGVTALAEMVGRFGGRVGASRYDGDAHLIDLTVPRDRYPDFAREVARLGRWQAEADVADLPETVRVRIRLTR